jgi:hypothetical protein
MILSAHQPNYWPYAGFFGKIMLSDKFMYMGTVQFEKTSWQNRNRIRIADGWAYLTVPVITKGKLGQSIREVEIADKTDWRSKHRKSIEMNYGKAPFFNHYKDFIEDLYTRSWYSIYDLNIYISNFVFKELDIATEILYDNDYPLTAAKTARLAEMCKNTDCDTFLSNSGSQAYFDINYFVQTGLNNVFMEYVGTEYEQQYAGFVPHLSILDVLMNCGSSYAKSVLCDKSSYIFGEINQLLKE